jgi:hypothetical protein
MQYLDAKLSSPRSINDRCIVGGDFNLDFARVGDKTYQHSKMLNKLGIWAATHGLSQLIKDVTRSRLVQAKDGPRLEQSIIDHLYSSEPDDFDLLNIGVSDHLAICLSLQSTTMAHNTEKLIRRDWRKYNARNLELLTEKDKQFHSLLEKLNEYSSSETLNEGINNIHRYILDKLAPERVFRLRAKNQFINSSVEALKKKRNRAYREYKATGDVNFLVKSQILSKRLRIKLKYVERDRISKKAQAKDAKVFWSMVSELRGETKITPKMSIKVESGITTNNGVIANTFGKFFTDKVTRLSAQTIPESQPDVSWNDHSELDITPLEVALVSRTLKPKKSYGIDGIPMCIVKDLEPYLRSHYSRLFRLASIKQPSIWKLARVIPLHKKGDRTEPSNYRPISNLCSIGKFFEKIILNKLNEYGDLEGNHQHGFKAKHSTTTAVLDVQKALAERLDMSQNCVIYSVDLSAAFDMLRRKTLVNDLISNKLFDYRLIRVLDDFLSDRKCVVEVDGTRSEMFDVELGCVQGSVLGPKLFNLYTRQIPAILSSNAHITTYADDSYVIISLPKDADLNISEEVGACLFRHVEYLKGLGMVVNQDKTEIMYVQSKKSESCSASIVCGSSTILPLDKMKVLGLTMDSSLNWSKHIALTINKLSRLTGALRFMRKRLPDDKFLQVLTSQYYSTCYYANQVWLGSHTRMIDIRKLNGLHYKLLRIATKDWKNRTPRSVLDEVGRARPTTWSKYSTASTAIKILRDKVPVRLHRHLKDTLYYERRASNVIKFFDKSSKRVGR